MRSGIEVRAAIMQDKKGIAVGQNYEVGSKLYPKPLILICFDGWICSGSESHMI